MNPPELRSEEAAAAAPGAVEPSPFAPDLDAFREHWQDEADAAYLYRILATAERDPGRSDIYAQLAEVEDRHRAIWARLLTEAGRPVGEHRPGGATRLRAWLGRRLGPRFLLPLLLREEGREVMAYLDMYRSTSRSAPGSGEALLLARESAEHASQLAGLAGRGEEPWHRTESGGLLRSLIYGFNDGLTANFGLVAGVIGATAAQQHKAIVVAGVAGLVADALSMGSSGFLAAKSEQEVYGKEIETERDEIALMPEVERDELALLYRAKGMDGQTAERLATEAMGDPGRMLGEQVREELKIAHPSMSPLREGWITGIATGVGALIPVFPFFLWTGSTAMAISFGLAMFSHFAVGAARSVFTGRSLFRSGLDMFLVGFGVAGVGYVAGHWISRVL